MGHIALFPRGRALDIASGPGRNAVFLGEEGFVVDAVDNSRVGFDMALALMREKKVGINLIFADLERYVIRPETYRLIADFYYLDRDLVPDMIAGLVPGGYLIVETFTTDHPGYEKSENRRHYLAPRELPALLDGLAIVNYQETTIIEENMMKRVARAIARKD